MKIPMRVVGLAAAALLSACSGGSTSPDAATYPTAVDGYEGVGGDDTVATASRVVVGERQARTLFPDGDVDYVEVALEAGVEYEFSANRLSYNSDLYLTLFDTDGAASLASSDDEISLDPRFRYTPVAAGTFVLHVQSYEARWGTPIGQAAYTLSVHLVVDADGDGWSTYYDCRDGDAAINPDATEVVADGVDQDCDGMDALSPTAADAAEPDGTPAGAKPMQIAVGDPYEFIFWGAARRANARTLSDAGDVDWFTLTVPAHGAIYVNRDWSATASPDLAVFDSDGTTELRAPSSSNFLVENASATAKRYYLRFTTTSAAGLAYGPAAIPYGVDLDGDGAYDQDWDGDRDCDDADPAIHPGAVELAGDAVDQDCDGLVDT